LEVTDLFSYWRDYPPTHVLVGAYLSGAKKNPSFKSRKGSIKTSFDELAQAVASAGGAVNNLLPAVYKV
jgi:hypothetical protein